MSDVKKSDGYCWGCEVKEELNDLRKRRKEHFRVNINPDSEIGYEIKRIANLVRGIYYNVKEVKVGVECNTETMRGLRNALDKMEQMVAGINERLELQEALLSGKLSSGESTQHPDQR